MTKELNLPAWAQLLAPSRVEVDASAFYPEILNELGIHESQITQYWLEVAKSIMKYDVRVAVAGTDAAVPVNGALTILVNDDTKQGGVSKYAQAAYPEGGGAFAGAKDAAGYYKKLRGYMPA